MLRLGWICGDFTSAEVRTLSNDGGVSAPGVCLELTSLSQGFFGHTILAMPYIRVSTGGCPVSTRVWFIAWHWLSEVKLEERYRRGVDGIVFSSLFCGHLHGGVQASVGDAAGWNGPMGYVTLI